MPNRNYEAGRRFEYLRKRTWENKGYLVLRTAGSHGAFDLVAIPRDGEGSIFLIQCKRTSSKSEARKLMTQFRKNLPLPQGKTYCQVLEIGIKGERELTEMRA